MPYISMILGWDGVTEYVNSIFGVKSFSLMIAFTQNIMIYDKNFCETVIECPKAISHVMFQEIFYLKRTGVALSSTFSSCTLSGNIRLSRAKDAERTRGHHLTVQPYKADT